MEFYTRGNNHRWKANIKVPGTFAPHHFEFTGICTKIKCILVTNLETNWCKVIEMWISEMMVTFSSHLITRICSVRVGQCLILLLIKRCNQDRSN